MRTREKSNILSESEDLAASALHPAHDLAARASSRNGRSPADHAIAYSADIGSRADVVAAHVYAEASNLDERSHRGEVRVDVGFAPGPGEAVTIDVSPDGDAALDRGGFWLAFGPHGPLDTCPRFEGQVRVDYVDTGRSRVVAQGRYMGSEPRVLLVEPQSRRAAEEALGQIVGLLTAGLR